MARFVARLAFVALAATPAVAKTDVHGPSGASLGKVIAMLQNMAAKAKTEKQNEEVAFSKFNQWCKDTSASLKNGISEGASAIESLTAEIGKLSSDVTGLGGSIAGLQADVEQATADSKSSTEQRAKDNEAFLAESKDYSESVDALDRAIAVMQKENYDRPASAAALLQLSDEPNMPEKVRSIVAAFMGMGQEPGTAEELAYDAPEANAYEYQSTSIIDLLKKLSDQFRSKLGDSQKEEQNSVHAFNMVIEDLKDSIENSKKAISEQSIEKKRKEETIAMNQKELAVTETTKAEDEKVLAEMTAECTEKKDSFDEKQQTRAEEIQAIEKATEVLSSPEVAANTAKYMTLAQSSKKGVALLQSHGGSAGGTAVETEGIHKKIRDFLEGEGQRLHSKNLALLAQKMAADPFAKVKSMIDGMITRLLEEANADADHEGFCDTEMGKSKITRNKLQEDIDSLAAAVDEGKATIAQLAESITTSDQELAELQKAISEATEMRSAEKATNAETVKDAKQAQAAVQAATAVLNEYYSKALTSTALLQTPTMGSDEWDSLANPAFKGTIDKGHKEGMQTFGETYSGNQEGAAGVMALLEVVLSDFATLEADTLSSEASAQKGFEDFMTESKKTKATKNRQVEMNAADKSKAEANVVSDTADMKATQDQLLAADRYYEKLVPQCIDQGMTFEERTAARQAEITSLKEALTILSSQGSVA